MEKLITLVFAGDCRYEFTQEEEIAESFLEMIKELIRNKRGGLIIDTKDGEKAIFNMDNLSYATVEDYKKDADTSGRIVGYNIPFYSRLR